MRTKLLFAAALMAATAGGTQTVRAGSGENLLLELLEDNVWQVAVPLAESNDKERPTEDNTDVTEWIVNPSFDNNTSEGWTCNATIGFSGSTGVYCGTAEVYDAAFDAYQDITGLPNGKYEVSVQTVCNRQDRGYFYRNTYLGYLSTVVADGLQNGYSLQSISAAFEEDPMLNKHILSDIIVVDGNLRIGVGWNGYVATSWMVFDNFTLTYVDNGYDEIKALYDGKKTEVLALTDDSRVQPLLARLQNLAAETVDDNSDALGAAYVGMNDLQTLYQSDETSDLRDRINSYAAMAGYASDDVAEAVNSAIDVAVASLDTVTTTSGMQQISNALHEACSAALAEADDIVIVETDFNDGTAEGWNNPGSFNYGVMEYFGLSFDFYREFSGLPEGWYQVTLNGFYRNGEADKGESYLANTYINYWRVYANDYALPLMCLYEETGTTPWEGEAGGADGDYPGGMLSANTNFEAGLYLNTLNVWVSGDGALRVGVSGGGSEVRRWVCLDNVKVVYKGMDLQGICEAMAEQAGTNAAKVNTAYQTKIETLAGNLLHDNEEDYAVADVLALDSILQDYVALKNAIAQFNIDDVINSYSKEMTELLAISESSDDVKAAYESSITAAEEAMAVVAGLDEVEAVRTDLENARVDYLFTATPTEGNSFDFTFLLTNPDVFGWARYSTPTGWSCDISRDIFQVQNNSAQAGETVGVRECWEFVEIWSSGNLLPNEDGNGWGLYQSVALPVGAYQLTAYTFGDDPFNNDATLSDIPSAHLSAGYGTTTLAQGDSIAYGAMKLTSLSFYLDEASTADNPTKLGIYIHSDNECSWFGINDMKLYKVAPVAEELSLSENDEAYAVTSDTYANVKLARKMEAKASDGRTDKWHTFCVPFNMTAEDLEANGISEVRSFTGATVQGEAVTLVSTVVDNVEAGMPYIIKVSRDVDTITVTGVSVKAAAPQPQRIAYAGVGYVEMTGNYSLGTVPTGAYFINDNMFYLADETAEVTLKGFRAYVTIVDDEEETVASGVNRLYIEGIGGVTSGLEGIRAEGTADAGKTVDVYTLGGVKVKGGVKKAEALDGLQRGIYIVDGQKVVK